MIVFACITVCKLILACNICKVESITEELLVPTSCTDGTYYSRDYMKCIPCSTCDIYSTMFSTCTATSDTVCIKCADTSSQQDLNNHPACKKCLPCKAGEYLEAKCTDSTNTVCRPCPVGSFSELPSYRTYCFPCTSCLNKVMIRDCTSSMDTECGHCKKGYFKDPSRNQCNPCVSCIPEQPIAEECKNGRPGKMCTPYILSRVEYVDIPPIEEIDTSTPLQMLTSTKYLSALTASEEDSLETASVNLSEEDLRETTTLSTLDVTVILTVILSIFILSIMIILLRRRLKTQLRKIGLIDDDDNDHANLFLVNFGHEDDFTDSQNSTESSLSSDHVEQNKSMDLGYIENESAPDAGGGGVSYLMSLQSDNKMKETAIQNQRHLFLPHPTFCGNHMSCTHECRKHSRHA